MVMAEVSWHLPLIATLILGMFISLATLRLVGSAAGTFMVSIKERLRKEASRVMWKRQR